MRRWLVPLLVVGAVVVAGGAGWASRRDASPSGSTPSAASTVPAFDGAAVVDSMRAQDAKTTAHVIRVTRDGTALWADTDLSAGTLFVPLTVCNLLTIWELQNRSAGFVAAGVRDSAGAVVSWRPTIDSNCS